MCSVTGALLWGTPPTTMVRTIQVALGTSPGLSHLGDMCSKEWPIVFQCETQQSVVLHLCVNSKRL